MPHREMQVVAVPGFLVRVHRLLTLLRLAFGEGRVRFTRPQVFDRTSMSKPGAPPLLRILAVGAEALSMTPSGDALFAS